MAGMNAFDSIVIGAGQAGPPLAVKLAGRGERVALIEAAQLGGTCINDGCTPTKTLRKSARVAWLAGRGAEFGVETGGIVIDFAQAMDRMQERVDTARDGLGRWIASSGVTIVKGLGGLAGREGELFVVAVDGEPRLRAPKIFLNTGARPFAPPIPGLDATPFLDNRALLALRERPGHLVIIGGSYIGLELAQIFRRLGSQVTILEGAPRVAAREDADISGMIAGIMESEGVRVRTGVKIESVSATPDGGVSIEMADQIVSGTHVLVATGRTPNSEKLGLEGVGIKTGPHGYITTNGRLETSTPGIWALGDVNGRGAFTHTSYHDFEIVADNLAGADRSADERTMTYAMFTDPPLGHVGLHEHEARKLVGAGRHILMAVHDMKDVSRAKEESETAGRLRLIVDGDSGRFLGATILGLNADEIIQIFVHFIAAGGHWRQMRNALPIHPTVAEFLPTILDKLAPLSEG